MSNSKRLSIWVKQMNAILSIKPEFVKEIVTGKKLFEYRKSVFKRPVEKVYIYASAPISKVVGEFRPVDILSGAPDEIWERTRYSAGISEQFYDEYFAGRTEAFAILIQNLKIYETPKELPFHAPQNFRYVESI